MSVFMHWKSHYHHLTSNHLVEDPSSSEFINEIRLVCKQDVKEYIRIFKHAYILFTYDHRFYREIFSNPVSVSNIRVYVKVQSTDGIESYIVCVFEPKPGKIKYESIFDYNMNVYDFTSEDIRKFNKMNTFNTIYMVSLVATVMFFIAILLWVLIDFVVNGNIDVLGMLIVIVSSMVVGIVFGRMSILTHRSIVDDNSENRLKHH